MVQSNISYPFLKPHNVTHWLIQIPHFKKLATNHSTIFHTVYYKYFIQNVTLAPDS